MRAFVKLERNMRQIGARARRFNSLRPETAEQSEQTQ
jgi:hypothetical protein